jgi:predicted TIM-barrel fold metal-dependent hydrolase
MEDPLMNEEIALLGEDQLLYSSDYPHGEAREDAAQNLLDRKDVSETQKQKILYNNPIDLQRAVIMLNSFAAPSNSASVVPD